jgi:hypothetical protein
MFGLNFRPSTRLAALTASLVLLAISPLAPAAQASVAGVAQRPPLAQDGGACAVGHFYDLVMPDGVYVRTPCPGTEGGALAYSQRTSASAQHFARAGISAPVQRATTGNNEACIDGYRWDRMIGLMRCG